MTYEDSFRNKTAARETPMFSEIRISRLKQPRATLFAIVLLVVVFLLFGAFASAVEPSYTPRANTLEGPAMLLDQWVFGS